MDKKHYELCAKIDQMKKIGVERIALTHADMECILKNNSVIRKRYKNMPERFFWHDIEFYIVPK